MFLNGSSSEFADYELFVECIPSQVTSGLIFQRLNPVVTFEDGTKYSLTAEATYEIIRGSGEVTIDGRFEVTPEESMTVRISYGTLSEEIELSNCL